MVTCGISKITEDGIIDEDGATHPADAIIFGTGFQATDALSKIKITGRNGFNLNDAWQEGAEGYHGSTVAGFPNMFLVTGPNTGLGHKFNGVHDRSNVKHMIDVLRDVRDEDKNLVEVKREAQIEFNRRLQDRLKSSVWVTGCNSWYQDSRSGKITTLWPGFSTQYWALTQRYVRDDYLLH